MKICMRVRNLEESATIAVSNKAAQMKADGIDVVSLGAGEPDFDTPEHIKEVAWRALRSGQTKYAKPASGIPELKRAIVEKFRRDNRLEYDSSHVLVSVGGKEALWLAFATLLDPEDEVIIPAPYWVSYPEQVKLAGGKPIIIRAEFDHAHKITPDQLQRALTPRTRCFVFNSPCNPSGAVYSPEEVLALARVLEGHDDVIVFSDEIYDRLIYDGLQHRSFATASDHAFNHTLTFNAGSKTYSMTGWRIGYAAGPLELIRNMAKLQSQTTSGAVTFNMHALAAALTGDQSCVEQMRLEFEQRAQYLHDRLNNMNGVVCQPPAGAFYVFPDVSSTYARLGVSGSIEWVGRLLEEAHVSLVPGAAFGSDQCVRLSFATSMANLKNGLDRLEKFLSF